MKTFLEILQLIAQLIPIIEAAFGQFGNTPAALAMVSSAIPSELPAEHNEHLMNFAANHLILLEGKSK